MKGQLYLEDGSLYEGEGFGAAATCVGELVFNTSMTGYQKILTDPSYSGQIITMTYPLIGNYGINDEDNQSDKIYAFGLVVKEPCNEPSNYRCKKTLSEWLVEMGIPGVSGLDTRQITKRIRKQGTVKCVISTENKSVMELKKLCDEAELRGDYMKEASWAAAKYSDFSIKGGLAGGCASAAGVCSGAAAGAAASSGCVGAAAAAGSSPAAAAKYKVAVLDFGIKQSILDDLESYGCGIKIFPYGFTAEEVLASNPDGVFLSNGPGDPEEATEAIAEVKKLMQANKPDGKPLPMFGICMGHQILALAAGGETYKLKYGHRGGNHGVYNKETDRSYITSQNHGYAVKAESMILKNMDVTEVNLNDKTVEGMKHRERPIFSVQYHPEASPGPCDSKYLFEKFTQLMDE